jgi:hypothetical protein
MKEHAFAGNPSGPDACCRRKCLRPAGHSICSRVAPGSQALESRIRREGFAPFAAPRRRLSSRFPLHQRKRRTFALSAWEADDGSRTRDLELGKLALYQLSYVRKAVILRGIRTRSSRSHPLRSEHIQNIGTGPRQPASLKDVVLDAPALSGLGVDQVLVGRHRNLRRVAELMSDRNVGPAARGVEARGRVAEVVRL